MADIVVKPASSLQDKFGTRTQNATPEYVVGVKTTTKDQNSLAQAASGRWFLALQAANTADLFKKGLARSSTAIWQAMASTKGATNFGPGAMAAKAKWAARVQPFFDALNAIVFTQSRLPTGDPGNQSRSAQVNSTLHAKKVAGA